MSIKPHNVMTSNAVARPALMPCKIAALSAALLLSGLLSGCAYIPHDQIVKGATTASPAPAAPTVANGSIFQSVQPMNYGYQPLFDELNGRPFVNNDHYARVLLKLD